MIRKFLFLVGVLLIIIGGTQFPLASWWINNAPKLMNTYFLFGFGAMGVVLGIVFVGAAASGAVGLRQIIFVLGLYMLLAGIIALANQNLIRDLADALLFNRSRTFQMAVMWISAVIRVGLGGAIIYAAARPPARANQITGIADQPGLEQSSQKTRM